MLLVNSRMMFSLYKTFPGHFMTETSGERHFAFYLLKSFILPLHSDWIILCPYGWMADYSVLQQQYELSLLPLAAK